jgi:dCTP deaminase
MAFWSTQRIKSEQQQLRDLIDPFDPNNIQQGAYEMCLSDQVLTTPSYSAPPTEIVGDVLMVEPGQFGLLYTREKVHLPDKVIAFISIKASIKLKGLVNISGFHVDPAYHGRLKFSVYNAGTEAVPLEIGKPTFLIWFADLDQPTEDPYAEPHQHVDQAGITPEDRVRMRKPVPSPTALDERLKILEDHWRISVATAKYFVLPTGVAIGAGIVLWLLTTILPGRSPDRLIGPRKTPARPVIASPAPASIERTSAPTARQEKSPTITASATAAPSATLSPSAAPRP